MTNVVYLPPLGKKVYMRKDCCVKSGKEKDIYPLSALVVVKWLKYCSKVDEKIKPEKCNLLCFRGLQLACQLVQIGGKSIISYLQFPYV